MIPLLDLDKGSLNYRAQFSQNHCILETPENFRTSINRIQDQIYKSFLTSIIQFRFILDVIRNGILAKKKKKKKKKKGFLYGQTKIITSKET